jgi:peptidyl-prolyl cis-trans isomerase C
MRTQLCRSMAMVLLSLTATGVFGQAQPSQPKDQVPPPANFVAATVNGWPISELAVFRAIAPQERKKYETRRKDILEHLIENALIDQYLLYLKIDVDVKEIDEKMAQIRTEAAKKGGLEKVLKDNFVTESELRHELAGLLRWERFVIKQATDETLRDFFSKNKAIFDGSQMHARHILLKVDERLNKEQAIARLTQLKKWMEEETQRQLEKLPPDARDQKRLNETVERVFADVAKKESACPSSENGGDLPWFQRDGMMVESFARTAFALRPYQMSDVVATKFGYHLILAVDRKIGKEVKFEDPQVRVLVREVYSDRLRDSVIAAMRPNAKIIINPPGK